LKLQRIENKVYRQILGAPSYAQVSALRGEIGASSMTSRIMEGKIKLLKHTLSREGSLLRKVTTERKAIKASKWSKNIEFYLKRVNIDYQKLNDLTKDEVKKAVKKWDTLQWKSELKEKKSLEVYSKWKTEMGGMEKTFDNTPSSVIFYKARTNVLPLNDRKRWSNDETKCKACGAEIEDLRHLIMYCPVYNDIRGTIPELQQPYQEIENDVIGAYLFGNNPEDCKRTLKKLWRKRQFMEKLADTG